MLIAFLLLFAFFTLDPQYTGLTTISGDLAIKAPDTQPANTNIEGEINLTIQGTFGSSDSIILSIGNETRTLTLKYILDQTNISYAPITRLETASNPEITKTLDFARAETKTLGIKLRKNIDSITEISMNIEGQTNQITYPKKPKLDFGSKGTNDWEFLGDFIGFKSDPIYPLGLNTQSETVLELTNPAVSFCESINIPKSNNYKISAKIDNNGADTITLKLLNDNWDEQGSCDLTPLPLSLDWYECEINLIPNPTLTDTILACVTFSGTSIKLAADTDTTSITALTCQNNFCTPDSEFDYYIRAFPSELSEKLTVLTNLQDWETSPDTIKQSIENYLFDCVADFNGDCTLPLDITTETTGIVKLSNLNIKSQTATGVILTADKFYDLSTTSDNFEIINTTQIIIPMSLFELKSPAEESNYQLKIETTFGLATEVSIELVKGLETESTVAGKIDLSKNILTILSDTDTIKALNLEEDIQLTLTRLNRYKLDISSLTNKTESEKEAAINLITDGLDQVLANLPKSIDTQKQITYSQTPIPFENVEGFIDVAVYQLQNKAEIRTQVQLINVTYFSGAIKTFTTFKDTISSKEQSIKIIKFIPKSIATKASNIIFNPQPSKILKNDPLVEFTISSQENIFMAIQGDVIGKIGEVSNLYVPITGVPKAPTGINCGNGVCDIREDFNSCPEDCLCGNNICDDSESQDTCPQDCGPESKSSNVVTILIIIAVVGIIVGFIVHHFKKRKKPAKKIFKSEAELIKLRAYIKTALKKGSTKAQITGILISKGWKKEQITEAFRNL